ncbi:MAG TPA: methionine synthase, partial [Mycobacteriales bacterium]|nr:methionine synthase [Mycobacteriales bacterium]
WQLCAHAGRDLRHSRDLLARDLDALQAQADGYSGVLKLQAAGPWTLAAGIELHRGDKALADPGAVRDLGQSLTAGLAEHLADVRRRVPGARLLVQLDEPSLPAVLGGRIRTASGFERLPAVEESTVESSLSDVISGLDAPVAIHCCAGDPPIGLFRRAGAAAVAVDAALFKDEDAVGEVIDAGMLLFLGVVPGTDTGRVDAAQPARGLWHRLGFPPEDLAARVVLTPSCGLAGATPGYARQALTWCREAGRALVNSPEPD